jgi:hypothetical protein
VFFFAVFVFSAGSLPFSTPNPTPEQIDAALAKFIKQDNPNASVSPSFGFKRVTPDAFSVDFQFNNFAYKDESGATQTIASGKGSAMFNKRTGKWVLDSVFIGEPGSQKSFYPNIEFQESR